MHNRLYDIIVVGGGAAGMMAAWAAAGNGSRVLLLEKNEKLGKKIYITGKGRCNVTNAAGAESFFENVTSNAKFLYSAFYAFDNQQLMRFMEEHGCRLKVERGQRVFPVSDHASDVTAACRRALEQRNVEIRLNTPVKGLWLENGTEGVPEEQVLRGVVLKDGSRLAAGAVIVATGGLSYPTTGSTGDGYRWARASGHQIRECAPSLVPFEVEEAWVGKLQGLALKNVEVTLACGRKQVFCGFGEMLFTHFGVSGPLILTASSFYRPGQEAVLRIDLKPALTREQLDKRLLRDFEENRNRRFCNALSGLFPARLVPVMVAVSGLAPDKKVNEITREERLRFAERTKGLTLTVKGLRGYDEAVITKGGVSVKDINPSTMESKRVRNLYFAGEVLDVDALTGGFNLQIAWSTGYLAGAGTDKRKEDEDGL